MTCHDQARNEKGEEFCARRRGSPVSGMHGLESKSLPLLRLALRGQSEGGKNGIGQYSD